MRGCGTRGLRHLCVQVLAALLHALPLKEDLEEWVTIGHLFSFLYQSSPDQVMLMLAALRGACCLSGRIGLACS